jgi:Rieske Fe-S protein
MMIQNPITRRQFVGGLTMIGAAGAVSILISSPAACAAPSDMVEIGKTSDFEQGETKRVTLPDGTSVYVTRDGDSFRALSAKCTHKGCDVLWVPDRKIFQCPCHGGQFDASGNVIAGPPPAPLHSRATKVDAGMVYVGA